MAKYDWLRKARMRWRMRCKKRTQTQRLAVTCVKETTKHVEMKMALATFSKRTLLFLFLFLFFCLSLSSSTPQLNQDFTQSGTSRQVQEDVHEIHCSRERSRAAWTIIQQYLMPFVEKERYRISTKCRLHPDNDVYRDQELHKFRKDVNEWRCGYCKKSFYQETHLDQHFDNRHFNLLNESHGRCLADLCGALHCDLVLDNVQRKSKCNPAAAARNKHLCESLANSCFPVNEGPSAGRLHEFFLRQFCDAHTCTGNQKPFSKGCRKRTSILYIAISILTVMLLPLIYLFVYLYQRGIKRGSQELKRISLSGRKKKAF